MEAFVLISFILSTFQLISGDFAVQTDAYIEDTAGDVLAAFGDFNGDKLVDIFVIKSWGKQVDLLLAVQDKKFDRHTLISNSSWNSDNGNITGVILADFDGDVQMDVLVVINTTAGHQMSLYWGKGQSQGNISVDDDPFVFFDHSFKDDPVLFDYNANMLPDLLTVSTINGSNSVWMVSDKCRQTSQASDVGCRNFTSTDIFDDVVMFTPHSSAFVDVLFDDFNADLVLSVESGYEIRYGKEFSESTQKYSYPPDANFVGQSSFADFNLDGRIEQIVPVCGAGAGCSSNNSQIYVFNNGSWEQIFSPYPGWQFMREGSKFAGFNFPTTLRIGDYDMDGYPDIVTVLSSSTFPARQRAFLLHNVPCTMPSCMTFGRSFVVADVLPVGDAETVHLATFFDTDEDGSLDVLLTAVNNVTSVAHSIFVKNNFEDSCFLKVTVLSGQCFKSCSHGYLPYGVNVPGPTIKYIMTTISGAVQKTTAGQLSQSAHFALQLPFVVFGLGQTPNFVDQLDVGIPTPDKERMWQFPQQIIPNSQLIVIPYPPGEPHNWKMQLFVTPSRQIKYTGFALLITCGLLAIIIVILQWQEMREDAKEKKNDSQKFHFDAM